MPAPDTTLLVTENTTLKWRVQELTREHRALQERLEAARSNLRFADKRIADLEARLLSSPCPIGLLASDGPVATDPLHGIHASTCVAYTQRLLLWLVGGAGTLLAERGISCPSAIPFPPRTRGPTTLRR